MKTETIEPEESNYSKYRGKCREMSEDAIAADPSLTLVRGNYICPMWGSQPHWWTIRPDGTIYDPSVKQFPTAGFAADYVPHDGNGCWRNPSMEILAEILSGFNRILATSH